MPQVHTSSSASERQPRPPKPKQDAAIVTVTRRWLDALPTDLATQLDLASNTEPLLAEVPKRHTLYEPMMMLPARSFSGTHWQEFLSRAQLPQHHIDALWRAILASVQRPRARPVTHLAVNEGIPPVLDADTDTSAAANIIRSPAALKVLYGDFGPSESPSSPTADDFAAAFWVSTKQVGFHQTWAPRWTMFSRGNVKEKERILNFHSHPLTPTRGATSFASAGEPWAVDLYAGIGYFTFAYAKQGARVLCWEINPWSVEALRRGARANGWSVRVVSGPSLALPTSQLVTGDERIVVFLEDNQRAAARIREMRAAGTTALDILHVNCGLLPRSDLVWRPAWDAVSGNRRQRDCWLHLHENVGARDIERRRDEIQQLFDGWAAPEDERMVSRGAVVHVEHIERVKTYAPDVWHCVFDVYIRLGEAKRDEEKNDA